MKINYDQELLDLSGVPFEVTGSGKPTTIKEAIVTACSLGLPGDEKLTMVEKFSIGESAAIVSRGEELTAERVAVIKDRIARGFNSPVFVYVTLKAIEEGVRE